MIFQLHLWFVLTVPGLNEVDLSSSDKLQIFCRVVASKSCFSVPLNNTRFEMEKSGGDHCNFM